MNRANLSLVYSFCFCTVATLLAPVSGFAQSVVPEVAAPPSAAHSAGTPRQEAYLKASIAERAKIVEQLGEDGAQAWAKSKGYQPLLDGTAKSIPQGPDQIYRAADGVIHVNEAKGGSSYLGHAYGYPQGSPEWAVESANRLIRSAKATAGEKEAAKAVLEAAMKGKLEVHVIRVSHSLGEPSAAVVKQSLKSTEQGAKLARSALDDLAKASSEAATKAADGLAKSGESAADSARTASKAAEGAVEAAATGSKVLGGVAKGALVVGVAVDAGLRINDGVNVERRFANGEITAQQREVAHSKNVAGCAGGWGGAWAGVELGGMGGGAAGAACAGVGAPVGAAAGAVVGGVAGYFGGEAAAAGAAEWAVNKVHATGTTIAESSRYAWNKTKDAAQATGQAISDAWSWVTGR